jgi:hypothetical protein
MGIRFTWELTFDLPNWVDKIHDYIWEDSDDVEER